jgi:putative nucleotidyltransferase with HDIG domain
MLDYGMPPASGLGVSERGFWSLENVTAREGTLFPQMKRHTSNLTKAIYGIVDPVAKTSTKKVAKSKTLTKSNISRDQALAIVKEFVKSESLVRHMLAVESAMAAYAKKFGEDEEVYRVTGLLHDYDWEIHPTIEEHPQAGGDVLRQRRVNEEIIRAIMSHALHTGVSRDSNLEKALFACDEITGLITTTALVRPSKKISEVETQSIKKKWKDKGFAAGVNREEVEQGAKELGVDLWSEHIPTVLKAMQETGELGRNYRR